MDHYPCVFNVYELVKIEILIMQQIHINKST